MLRKVEGEGTYVGDVVAVEASALAEVAAPARGVAIKTDGVDVAQRVGLKIVRPREGSLVRVSNIISPLSQGRRTALGALWKTGTSMPAARAPS